MSSHQGLLADRHRLTRSRGRARASSAFFIVTCAFALVLGGCGGGEEEPNALTKTISSESGLEMKVPASWREDTALNAQADLQASNREAEAYALVIPDLKQEFVNPKLEDFATMAKDNFIKGIQNPNVTGPRQLTLNGKPAIRYEIQGVAENVRVVYLMTLMETDSRFLQVIAWSLPDRLSENRPILEDVTASIRETRPASPSPPTAPGAPPAAPPQSPGAPAPAVPSPAP
ncbi:MAG TPA: hypothetical protein VHJ40_04815 [Actinomycetota bacterium]|nr:hypothetical protein [Actinomycetota bacterium]